MTTRDAAFVAREIGKTENWVKRTKPQPNRKFGRTVVWSDEDIAEILRRARQGDVERGDSDLRPITGRRAS